MKMEASETVALFAIVRAAIVALGEAETASTIHAAHMGRPRSFINNANLHLFRQYRNRVSANPQTLINEAKQDANY